MFGGGIFGCGERPRQGLAAFAASVQVHCKLSLSRLDSPPKVLIASSRSHSFVRLDPGLHATSFTNHTVEQESETPTHQIQLLSSPPVVSSLLHQPTINPRPNVTMISDDELYRLAIFLGSLAMLLIVLYHFLEINAKDDGKPNATAAQKLVAKPVTPGQVKVAAR